jgi:hypothetical protein
MPEPLSIERWSFWSPDATDPLEWEALDQYQTESVPARQVPSSRVPASHRRRMSALSRMAVQLALEATEGLEVDFAVFCSRHGELARTSRLLASIADAEVLSPMEFSQSVHNTSAGLYSIARDIHDPTSSIAAGAASFATAWLEGEGYLSQNPESRVLLVDCDESLTREYAEFVDGDTCSYALALVLATGGNIEMGIGASSRSTPRPIGPLFLSWWLSGVPQLDVDAEGQRFTWVRATES